MEQRLRPGIPTQDPFPVAEGVCRAKMDQNESPWDMPVGFKESILDELKHASWSRYPQPSAYRDAKRELAGMLDVDPDFLAITSGCDQAIQGIHFVAGGASRKALVFHPTYPMLSHAGKMAGTMVTNVITTPEYTIDSSKFADHHLILLANPNNPTGNLTPRSIIDDALDQPGIVFIDEAYYDFSGVTLLGILQEHLNLAIGRSFSKTLLAGIRLGALMGHPPLIRSFESLLTAPYHLGHLQLIIARRYRELTPVIRNHCREIIESRRRMIDEMRVLGLQVYPSETNFILFKTDNANRIFEFLLGQGIRIRDMSSMKGLESHLRVTVGKDDDNRYFLRTLAQAILHGE